MPNKNTANYFMSLKESTISREDEPKLITFIIDQLHLFQTKCQKMPSLAMLDLPNVKAIW